MPKAKNPRKSEPTNPTQPYRSPDTDDWGGYINLSLNERHKEEFDRWLFNVGNSFWDIYDDLLGKGIKVGMSYDAQNQCYICTFTGRLVKDTEWRCVMTTRGSTHHEAIALSVWKFAILCEGDVSDYRVSNGKLARWG